MYASLGTHLIHRSAYHPQTDGQAERVNQILEDMLQACVLNYPDKWDKCLRFIEFSYKNSYQVSLRMAPFEDLYGRCCRTPVNWIEPGERTIFGPDLVTEAEEIVHRIQSNLKDAKQAMPTSDACRLSLKQATVCTFMSHPREV
jgi:hypothetical protein